MKIIAVVPAVAGSHKKAVIIPDENGPTIDLFFEGVDYVIDPAWKVTEHPRTEPIPFGNGYRARLFFDLISPTGDHFQVLWDEVGLPVFIIKRKA